MSCRELGPSNYPENRRPVKMRPRASCAHQVVPIPIEVPSIERGLDECRTARLPGRGWVVSGVYQSCSIRN